MEINKKNRTELKAFFQANDIPTEQHFADFVDAGLNQAEDGIAKVQGNPLALQAEGETSGTQEVLQLFSNFANDNPDWSLNLNPRVDSGVPDSNQPGLNIKDTTGQSRLFIQSGDGNIGIGTIEPEARLTIQGTGSGALIAAVADTEQHSRIFEVTEEADSGMLSLRAGDATLTTRLSGAIATPSFFLSNVGVGTANPEANLQVSGENAELRITNTHGGSGSNVRLGLYHSANINKAWEFVVRRSPANLEFLPVGNEDNKFIMQRSTGSLEAPGGLIFDKNRSHINRDGALYRNENNLYLTADNNFYIRDSGGSGSNRRFHFITDNSRLAIGGEHPQAPLSISGEGKEHTPDARMHLTNRSILFGGDNAGKAEHSAKIIANNNQLRIMGMASNNDLSTRKVNIFAEDGLTVQGHIKTPETYVVAFSVAISSNSLSGTRNPLTFGQINYNYGGHFESNQHFTAPVKGLYLFTMTISKHSSSGFCFWQLRLNDTGYVNGQSGSEIHERTLVRGTASQHSTSRTVLTQLNAGDTVHIHQTGSSRPDNHASGFEGILLQALE